MSKKTDSGDGGSGCSPFKKTYSCGSRGGGCTLGHVLGEHLAVGGLGGAIVG
jgi:hypothetical protein